MAADPTHSYRIGRSSFHRATLILGLFVAIVWINVQAAQPPHTQLSWQQLSPMQKEALAPLQPEWERFNADRKRKWLNIASRYPAMSPAQRATLHHRMTAWVNMTPQQRRMARENFLATGKAPLDSRKEAWERYQKLPDAEKRKLAREAKLPPQAPGSVSHFGAEEPRKHRPKTPASAPRVTASTAQAAKPAAPPPAPASRASE